MRFLLVAKLFLLVMLLCASCSLDYFEQGSSESSSPEFVFSDVDFSRIEDNALSIHMGSSKLEQYSDGGLTFAQAPDFTLYDSAGTITVMGFCELLSADTEKDEYSFYGDVLITSYEHDATIEASNLRWIGDDEIFVGAIDEKVFVSIGNQGVDDTSEQNNTELIVEGTGFSANGVDFSYAFAGPVQGRIVEE